MCILRYMGLEVQLFLYKLYTHTFKEFSGIKTNFHHRFILILNVANQSRHVWCSKFGSLVSPWKEHFSLKLEVIMVSDIVSSTSLVQEFTILCCFCPWMFSHYNIQHELHKLIIQPLEIQWLVSTNPYCSLLLCLFWLLAFLSSSSESFTFFEWSILSIVRETGTTAVYIYHSF